LAVPAPAHARKIGGAELSQRIAPQRHLPVIVIVWSRQQGEDLDHRSYVGEYRAGNYPGISQVVRSDS
jgi:hypothetical protein